MRGAARVLDEEPSLPRPCEQVLLRLQASGLSGDQARSAIRAQRDLFYIQFIDVAYFPCFQWRDLWLRKTIGRSLRFVGDTWTMWQLALWFVAENEWLAGRRPVDLLDTDPDQVVFAAEWAARGLSSTD